jgi:hypothetical protein
MIGHKYRPDKVGGATQASLVVGLNREIGRSGDFGVFWREPPEATLQDERVEVHEEAHGQVREVQ